MVESSQVIPRMSAAENVSTFEWRSLHLHVVTLEPLSPDRVRDITRSLAKVSSVGQAADILSMILGRSVRIRTERPSLDVRLEVGR
jgi:chemotaxis protein CheY-P-specific phosphatase CheC